MGVSQSRAVKHPAGTSGRPLPLAVVQAFGDLHFRIDGELLALHVAADGTAWTVEEPEVLRHWDVATGRQLSRAHLGVPELVWTFGPNGRVLVSGSDDLAFWDVGRAAHVRSETLPSWVTAQAFRGDGRLLATGHDDGLVRLWEPDARGQKGELASHRRPISTLAFSPDGSRLASAGEDKVVCIWDVTIGKLLGRCEGHTDRIQSLAWHPNGRELVSAGWDTTARVWDAATFEPLILLNGHGDVVSALRFSPDGRWLASADSDHVVWIWDYVARRPRHVLRGHTAAITTLAFSPDGRTLFSGGHDRQLILWDLATGKNLTGPAESTCESAAVSVSPDGTRLASVTGGSALRIWDTTGTKPPVRIEHPDRASAVRFSPDGRWLATGDLQGKVHLWEPNNGNLLNTLDAHQTGVTALAFSGDGRVLASAGGMDGYVYLWSLETFEPILLIPEAAGKVGAVESIAFLPNSNLIAAGGVDWSSPRGDRPVGDGQIGLWDWVARSRAGVLAGAAQRLAIRPDGNQLAASYGSEVVALWDLATSFRTGELRGHDAPVTCVVYSPDGHTLATAAADDTVRLWDAHSPRPLGCLDLGTSVKDLVFSPDGQRLYTANADGTCYALDVAQFT